MVAYATEPQNTLLIINVLCNLWLSVAHNILKKTVLSHKQTVDNQLIALFVAQVAGQCLVTYKYNNNGVILLIVNI